MAKQGLYGKFRGKLADVVGYKVANAKKPGTIATRAYVAEIANPKTTAQASQRMRMKPAINFYRGLASLLDHSWEGVKYGARSRAKFMSLALLPDVANIPFVDKGESRFIPGEYPVSIGSVSVPISISFGTASLGPNQTYVVPKCGIYFGDLNETTWGELSTKVLAANPSLQDGDELTFISVYEISGMYIPNHAYVVLDTTSLESVNDVYVSAGIYVGNVYGEFQPVSGVNNDRLVYTFSGKNCVAAAVIVSRHPNRNSTTWLRSSSTMVCSDTFKAQWMSNDRLLAAKQTYMNNTVALTSDWLLNQSENLGNDNALNPSTVYTVTNKTTAIGGLNVSMANLAVNGANEKPIIYSVGGNYYYGVLANNVITFLSSQVLSSNPSAGTYYTKDEAAAAATSYEWNTDDIDNDEPGVENP